LFQKYVAEDQHSAGKENVC